MVIMLLPYLVAGEEDKGVQLLPHPPEGKLYRRMQPVLPEFLNQYLKEKLYTQSSVVFSTGQHWRTTKAKPPVVYVPAEVEVFRYGVPHQPDMELWVSYLGEDGWEFTLQAQHFFHKLRFRSIRSVSGVLTKNLRVPALDLCSREIDFKRKQRLSKPKEQN